MVIRNVDIKLIQGDKGDKSLKIQF